MQRGTSRGPSLSHSLLLTIPTWLAAAVLLGLTRVEAQEGPFEPWVGEVGITETVAEIMARDRLLKPWDPSQGLRRGEETEEGFEKPVRRGFPQDPNSPSVAAWPPTSAAPVGPAPKTGGATPPSSPQAVGTSFLAATLGQSGFIPPDTVGAVSNTQVLVVANGRIKVFDKAGVLGALNVTTDSFFTSVRNGSGTSDPQVTYDRLSGRWFVTICNLATPNRILIAVSNTSTITNTASFTFHFFQQDTVAPVGNVGQFADYPKTGVDANAVYIGANMFAASYVGASAWVVRKSSVLGAGPIVVTAFRNIVPSAGGAGPFAPMGVNNDDPAATEGYIVGASNNSFGTLVLRRVSNPAGAPTISGNINLTVPTTGSPQNQNALGSSFTLDALDDRLFAAMMRKNRSTGISSLWTSHNIEVNSSGVASGSGNRNGSRWYQVDNLTGTPTLTQSGTLFDSAATNPRGFWIPSIAASGQGHMALGASYAGAADRIGVAVAGRLSGDTLGTTQAATLAVTSSTSYNVENNNGQRWGDYSHVVVDPIDDQTMWAFAEYCNANNSWGVRVLKLIAPPPATPASCSPPNVIQGASNVAVVLTGTSVSGSGFYDTEPGVNRIAASVSGSGVTVNSIAWNSPTSITLNLSVTAGATLGARTITVTNPDAQVAASAGGILTIDSSSCITITQHPTNQTACVGGSATFTVTQTGAPSPTFQWRKGGVNVPGATSSTLNINPVALSDAGSYDVVITDVCGTATSNAATLTVQSPVSISQHPASQLACAGNSRSFSVVAAGTATLTFQWRKNSVPLANGGHYSGVTTATLTVSLIAAPDIASYDVVVTNPCGSLTSNSATLAFDTTDTDGDGTPNCSDGCPNDPAKIAPGVCGCGVADTDSDGDGTPNCNDGCPNDPAKIAPGACGCGVPDTDSDGDGTPNCIDGCPNDPTKIAPGQCGCGVPDTDSDGDGTANCNDGCPNDPAKIAPGACGCGVADTDSDGDSWADCVDNCDLTPNVSQADGDLDGVGDDCDNCDTLANPGQEDCDTDQVGDACAIAQGAPDCNLNGVPDVCDLANQTSQDVNTNGVPDECEGGVGTPFCSGDGTVPTPCPCAPPDFVPSPPAAPGHGCANSFNLSGALMSAVGTTTPDTLLLSIDVGGNYVGFGFLLKGNASDLNGNPSGDGVLCVSGQLIRFGSHYAGTNGAPPGTWTYPNTVQTNPISVQTAQPAGQAAYYQLFYRQASPNFCNSATTNVSNGYAVNW